VCTSPPEQGKWFTSARLTDRVRAQLIRSEAVLSAQIGGYSRAGNVGIALLAVQLSQLRSDDGAGQLA